MGNIDNVGNGDVIDPGKAADRADPYPAGKAVGNAVGNVLYVESMGLVFAYEKIGADVP